MKFRIVEDKNDRKFSFWLARISAVLFVILTYILILDDFFQTMQNYPILYNFFIGTIILSLTVVLWEKDSKIGAMIFFIIGLVYPVIMWHKMLFVSNIATSVWLLMTAFLFLIDSYNLLPDYARKLKKVESKSGNRRVL